ncbi:MAG TPA: hypothetical protein DDZ88_23290 [Verrucomicrobiales bacterium]|nr:hypothetical protein [Verrucomicrobiales bacterium]
MKPAKNNSATPKAAAKNVTVPAAKPVKKPANSGKPARKRPAAPPVPPPAPTSDMEVTDVEIATRAYFIYVSEGCPPGREMQHWLDAEAQLRGQ